MIYFEKDPTLSALLRQRQLKAAGLYHGALDNWWGRASEAADHAWRRRFLRGNGKWPFTPELDQGDIILEDVCCTCFGGSDDPQDSGETASGINTKGNPDLLGASVPMDISKWKGVSAAVHAALDGCPIPVLDFFLPIQITSGKQTLVTQIIDLGPGLQATRKASEPHAVDLTVAAARHFNPRATARDFFMRCDVRIIGGAKYVES